MKESGHSRRNSSRKELQYIQKNAPPKGAPVPSKKELLAAARKAVALIATMHLAEYPSDQRIKVGKLQSYLYSGGVFAITLTDGRIIPTAKLWGGLKANDDVVDIVQVGDGSAAQVLWAISAYTDAGTSRCHHTAWFEEHAPELLHPSDYSYPGAPPHGGVPHFETMCEYLNKLPRNRRAELARAALASLKLKEKEVA